MRSLLKSEKVQEYDYIIILDQKGLYTYGHDKARNPKRKHENNKRGRNFTWRDTRCDLHTPPQPQMLPPQCYSPLENSKKHA